MRYGCLAAMCGFGARRGLRFLQNSSRGAENDKLCKVVSFKLNLFVSKILFHYLCTRKAVAA